MDDVFSTFELHPDGNVDEWANSGERILPPTSAEPGPWSTDRAPYLREIMQALPRRRLTVIMKCAQSGGTEVLLNLSGYVFRVDPGPAMIVQPTEDLAREWSRKRLTPLIEASPQLRSMWSGSKKDPDNSITFKSWPGGFLRIAYSTAPSQLRSDAIRYLELDEIDAYPKDVGGEGDPVELAFARTVTYGDRSCTVCVSTPTDEWSRIDRMFEGGDQRRWWWPCPHCDEYFCASVELEEHLSDDGKLNCPCCGVILQETDKREMNARGEWRADVPDADYASYHITGFMSPWMTWAEIARARTKSLESEEQLKTYKNTVLGIKHSPPTATESVLWEPLYYRRGHLRESEQGVVFTAGVDVQADRLELELVSWGPGMRSWSLEYHRLDGDPTQPAVWAKLDEFVPRTDRMCVDMSYLPDEVHAWASQRLQQGVIPIRGLTRGAALTIGKPSKDWVWPINVDLLKEQVYAWLDLEPQTPTPRGWCEFADHGQEYFEQLCAEALQMTSRGRKWVKSRARNEALDCRVYALAAVLIMGCHQWTDEQWANHRQPAPSKKPESRFGRSQWLYG